MAGSFGAINTALTAIRYRQVALDIASTNVANVGTDGYVRRRVVGGDPRRRERPCPVVPLDRGGRRGAGVSGRGVDRRAARRQGAPRARSADLPAKDQQALTDQVDSAGEQMAGVSLEEETINMISAQRAYEAAARVMTTLDSVLDTLINRTGLVR